MDILSCFANLYKNVRDYFYPYNLNKLNIYTFQSFKTVSKKDLLFCTPNQPPPPIVSSYRLSIFTNILEIQFVAFYTLEAYTIEFIHAKLT